MLALLPHLRARLSLLTDLRSGYYMPSLRSAMTTLSRSSFPSDLIAQRACPRSDKRSARALADGCRAGRIMKNSFISRFAVALALLVLAVTLSTRTFAQDLSVDLVSYW